MRLTLIFSTAIVLLISCNNSDSTKVASNTLTVNQQSDTTSNKSARQLLIEELKRLKAVFASKDKEKIADLFQFPLSDTSVGIYIDDSTFNAQLDKNGGKTTRAMFIRYFSDISESLQIDQLNQLFAKINIDNLLYKDSLEHEIIIKSEPCYHYYGVGVEKDLITLTVGTNSNKDYENKSISEDEIPENDSSICEHVLWWVFRFDGKKLHFKNISGAG
jgi:hypothetical protein